MATMPRNKLQAIALRWHFTEKGGASCFCCRLSYSRLRFYILCFYMAEHGVQIEFPFLQTGWFFLGFARIFLHFLRFFLHLPPKNTLPVTSKLAFSCVRGENPKT